MAARLLQGVLVVLAAATVAFVCLHLAPGDPATALGEGVPSDVRAMYRARYGFDQPIAEQYARWIGAILRGDLGWSIARQGPVLPIVLEATGNSLMIAVPAFVLSLAGGMLLGAWQAVHARTRRDRWTSAAALALYSMPEFWLAFVLMLLFARQWGILPATGMVSDVHVYMPTWDRIVDRLRHLVLPIVTITCVGVATFARFQRTSMRQMLRQPFVQAAHAAGLPRAQVWRDTWRAALLPVITVAGLLLPSFVAGLVLVEHVFAWRGIGHTMLLAIASRDVAVVTGCVVVGSAMTVAGAIGADVLRHAVDPRLRDAPTSGSGAMA